MKLKIALVITIIAVIIVGIVLSSDISLLYYEAKYTINDSPENLGKLCLKLLYTDNYEKQIVYFEKVLDYNEFRKVITEPSILYTNTISEVYDVLLARYLLALLRTEQYQTYLDQYELINNNFKEVGTKHLYLMAIIGDKETTNEQLHIILKSLQDNIPTEDKNLIDRIGNLNTQSAIYEILGDKQSAENIDKEVQQILNKQQESKK